MGALLHPVAIGHRIDVCAVINAIALGAAVMGCGMAMARHIRRDAYPPPRVSACGWPVTARPSATKAAGIDDAATATPWPGIDDAAAAATMTHGRIAAAGMARPEIA